MIHGVVLNHHSLPFNNRKSADEGIVTFLKVLQICRKFGLKVLLVDASLDRSLMGLLLTENYFVRDWFQQAQKSGVLVDWSRFLKSIETRQPLFDSVALTDIDNGTEVGLHDHASSEVMLAAYWFDTFLISFASSDYWLQHTFVVWVIDFRNGSDAEREHRLPNLVDDASLCFHQQTLSERRNALISTATDIWNKRLEFFPSLTLLGNQIGTALKTWSHRHDVLLKARDALVVLELFGSKWKNGECANYQHTILRDLGLAAEVSSESTSVANDPKKKNERMFWLDDGRQVYCENHVKLPDGYRLHFYADSANRHIYVAYLGPHLTI